MREGTDEAANPADDEQFGPEAVAQTLDQFIAGVIEAARNRDDFDTTLLAILTTHIVRVDPADEAVALAAAQIEALAEARALAPEKEPSDGEDNA
jgi:hypothetical protein